MRLRISPSQFVVMVWLLDSRNRGYSIGLLTHHTRRSVEACIRKGLVRPVRRGGGYLALTRQARAMAIKWRNNHEQIVRECLGE